jgi:hypothetical protein
MPVILGGNTGIYLASLTPVFTGLLDAYSGAAAAYSLRRLSSTYTGNLIRVRRSSDNAEQNIGYDANNVLDTASLLTFCGAGNGFVTTWYDQSGNANNATQTIALLQPQIVSSGAMITVNGKNSISFDGSNDELNLTSTINVGASNYQSYVAKRDASSRLIHALGQASGQGGYLLFLNTDNKYYLWAKSNQYIVSSATDTTTSQLLLTGLNNSGTMSIFKNGSSISTTTVGASTTINITKIGRHDASYNYSKLQEIVFYNSEQSANRTGIESNINTFYTIY